MCPFASLTRNLPSAARPLCYALIFFALLFVAIKQPVFAQTRPVWYRPTDSFSVLNTGKRGAFAYALVRDVAMHGHNVYYVAVGAHIGKLRVVRIDDSGIDLSNGRHLRNEHLSTEALATLNH